MSKYKTLALAFSAVFGEELDNEQAELIHLISNAWGDSGGKMTLDELASMRTHKGQKEHERHVNLGIESEDGIFEDVSDRKSRPMTKEEVRETFERIRIASGFSMEDIKNVLDEDGFPASLGKRSARIDDMPDTSF